MRVPLLPAAALGALQGVVAAVLWHAWPWLRGSTSFVVYTASYEPASRDSLQLGAPSWWPSMLVLPLVLAATGLLLALALGVLQSAGSRSGARRVEDA